MPDRIEVKGLREVRRGLKATGNAEGTRQLKAAGRKVAEDVVIPAARSKAGGVSHHSTGRSAMFSRAAGTLRPASTALGAAVRYGGGLPFAMGAEFGSSRFRQFNAHRGRDGWFLWPAIRDEGPRILDVYGDAVEDVFGDAAGR